MSLQASSTAAEYLCRAYEAGSAFFEVHKQTSFTAVESFFYNRVKTASDQASDLVRLVNRFAMNNFSLIQTAFSLAQAGLAVYTGKEIMTHLTHHTAKWLCTTALGAYLPGALLAITLVGVSWRLLSDKGSKSQNFSSAVLLTGIIQAVALAALTDKKVSLLFRAALMAYSFYKNNQMEWLTLKGSSDISGNLLSRVDVAYWALLPKGKPVDDCGICLYEQPDKVFCTNGHMFHRDCLETLLKSGEGNLFQFESAQRVQTKHYRNGCYTHSTWNWNVSILEQNLPSCPTCRERPPQNALEMTVHDRQHGAINASVTILREKEEDHQRTFEKVYAIYNAFQGTLGALQLVPELAPAATVARRLLLATDVVFGLMASYYCAKGLDEKGNRWTWAFILPTLGAVPLYMGLGRILGPDAKLPDGASWQRPWFEAGHRIWDCYRFIATIGLASVSKAHGAFSAISILGQGTALGGALSLAWLRVDSKCVDGTLSTFSLVPKSAFGCLQAVVSEVRDLQKRIFKEGMRTIYAHYTNGILTRYTAEISYSFPTVKDIREYAFKPFLWTWDGLKGRLYTSYGYLALTVN